MRKPVSKNSLRRAIDRAVADGQVHVDVPLNTVIDRIWHDMVRENYNGGRKKPSRASIRTAPPGDPLGSVEPAESTELLEPIEEPVEQA